MVEQKIQSAISNLMFGLTATDFIMSLLYTLSTAFLAAWLVSRKLGIKKFKQEIEQEIEQATKKLNKIEETLEQVQTMVAQTRQ